MVATMPPARRRHRLFQGKRSACRPKHPAKIATSAARACAPWPGETPCPTFRAVAAGGQLLPPRQPRLVIRPSAPLVSSPTALSVVSRRVDATHAGGPRKQSPWTPRRIILGVIVAVRPGRRARQPQPGGGQLRLLQDRGVALRRARPRDRARLRRRLALRRPPRPPQAPPRRRHVARRSGDAASARRRTLMRPAPYSSEASSATPSAMRSGVS